MILAPIVCIVGLILYLARIKKEPPLARVGEIMFIVGLVFSLYFFGNWKVF